MIESQACAVERMPAPTHIRSSSVGGALNLPPFSPLSEASHSYPAPQSWHTFPQEFLPPSRFRVTPPESVRLAKPQARRAPSSSLSGYSSSDVPSLPSGSFSGPSWSPALHLAPVSYGTSTTQERKSPPFDLGSSLAARARALSEMVDDESYEPELTSHVSGRDGRSLTCVEFGPITDAATGAQMSTSGVEEDNDMGEDNESSRRLGQEINRSTIKGFRRTRRFTAQRKRRVSLPNVIGGAQSKANAKKPSEEKALDSPKEEEKTRPFSGRLFLEQRDAGATVVSRVLRRIRRPADS